MPNRPSRSRSGRSRWAALATVTVAVGAAAGCGVAPSAPEDRGDRLPAVATVGDQVKSVPQPIASSADTLVSDFLMATVGGGEAAITQAQAFFTEKGAAAWKGSTNPQNTDLTVIHIVRGPTIGVLAGSRVPVTVDYQLVGQLNNNSGRVDELSRSTAGQMTFWVVPAPDNRYLRIDEIQGAPSGLLISDVALTEMYRIQPIYFWDANFEQLIPDLRYLPLTFNEQNRATRLVQWLLGGPSPWLTGAQSLPPGTAADPVQIRDEKYVVNLNAVAAAAGGETPEHLLPQLRWSLSNGSRSREVELQIDGKSMAADTNETFREFNQAWVNRETKPRFDIVDRKVVPASGGTAPAVLASPENLEVYRAAINREETVMALVRLRPSGQRYLQIVKAEGPTTLNVDLASFDMSRPSFVPGAQPYVVVASNGGLYLVSTENGAVRNITPNRIDDVTAAVVAPDGRRIAFIAGGQTYVSSLVVGAEGLTVGWSNPRPILADRVVASGVAWIDDTWLYIGGTAAGAPAMWRVTADGVVAEDESADLRGLTVTEVMAAPRWPASQFAEVIIYTSNSGPYLFSTSTTQIGEQLPFFRG